MSQHQTGPWPIILHCVAPSSSNGWDVPGRKPADGAFEGFQPTAPSAPMLVPNVEWKPAMRNSWAALPLSLAPHPPSSFQTRLSSHIAYWLAAPASYRLQVGLRRLCAGRLKCVRDHVR